MYAVSNQCCSWSLLCISVYASCPLPFCSPSAASAPGLLCCCLNCWDSLVSFCCIPAHYFDFCFGAFMFYPFQIMYLFSIGLITLCLGNIVFIQLLLKQQNRFLFNYEQDHQKIGLKPLRILLVGKVCEWGNPVFSSLSWLKLVKPCGELWYS